MVSFRFLPKGGGGGGGQNKDMCKIGGRVEQASSPGFSFHEHFVLLGGNCNHALSCIYQCTK